MPPLNETDVITLPTVAVTSQLMQSFELETPVVAGNSFCVAPLAGSPNQAQMFFVGSSGSLYCIFPDPNSSTGWASGAVTGTGATSLSTIAYGGAASGGDVILYVLAKNGAPSLLVVSNTEVQQCVPFFASGKSPKFCDIRAIDQGLGVARVTNTAQCYLLDCPIQNAPLPVSFSPSVMFGDGPAPVNDFCAAIFKSSATASGYVFAAIASYVTDGCDEVIMGGYNPQDNFSQFPLNNPSLVSQPALGKFAVIAASPFPSDSILLALTLDGQQILEYVNNQQSGTLESSPVNLTVPLFDIAACSSSTGLCIFGIGADHFIYHLAQTGSEWSGEACVDNSQIYVAIYALATADGDPQLFAVTQSGGVFVIFQDPESTDWSVTQIALEPASPQSAPQTNLQAAPIYSTSIVATNPDGTPYALQTASIASDSPVTIQVNGNYFYVDPSVPLSTITDLQGRIQIAQPIASLSSPVLCVTFPFMPEGGGIVVDPSGTIQQTIASVTPDQLTALNNCTIDNHGTTGPLLPAGTSATDVSEATKALNSAASMVQPWSTLSPPSSFAFARRTDRRVAGYAEKIEPKAFLAPRERVQGNGKWSIERSATGLRYLSGDAVTLPATTAFLGLDISWGDVVDAVKEGIYEAVKIAVDGVKAGITFLINGVSKTIEATIDTVARVFDVIGMVFEWIGAKFEQLFQWLAFIFNFDDIKAVAATLETAITGVLEFVPQALKIFAAKKFNPAAYSSLVQSYTSNAFANIPDSGQTGASLYASSEAGSNTGSDTGQFADDHSIARTGFSNNAAGASTGISSSVSASSNMKNLNTQMSNLFTQLQSTPGFQQWTSSGASWQTPSNVTSSAMSQIFSNAEPLALSAATPLLSMVETAIDAAADAISSFTSHYLTAPWDIPFISQFYKDVTGGDLTTVGLISLMVAVPTTMTLKLMCPEVFADTSWQQEFAQACTAASLLKASGLVPSSDLVRVVRFGPTGDSTTPPWQEVVGLVFGFVQGFLSMGSAFLEPLVDLYLSPTQVLSGPGLNNINSFATSLPGSTWKWMNGMIQGTWNPLFPFSVALCLMNLADWVLNCPFLTGTSGTDKPWGWNAFGYSNWLWICSIANPVCDMISIVTDKLSCRVSGDYFSFFYSLLGIGQLVAIIVMQSNFESDPQRQDGWAFAGMYSGCIPQIDKFMHISAVIEASEGWTYILLPIIDGAINKLTALLSFIEAEVTNPYSQNSLRAVRVPALGVAVAG